MSFSQQTWGTKVPIDIETGLPVWQNRIPVPLKDDVTVIFSDTNGDYWSVKPNSTIEPVGNSHPGINEIKQISFSVTQESGDPVIDFILKDDFKYAFGNENNLVYEDVGKYLWENVFPIDGSGPFKIGKTFFQYPGYIVGGITSNGFVSLSRVSDTIIRIETFDTNFVYSDGILNKTLLTVYIKP